MFLHAGLWHILVNMLFLFFFGRLLEEYIGRKKLISIYFLGGIAGGLLFIISYNLFPYLQDMVGGAFLIVASPSFMRSEERLVGKECVRTFSYRGSPYH